MKQLFTISMLCCLFFEVAGYFFAYKIHRTFIKKEVKQYLRDHKNEFEQQQFSFRLEQGKPVDKAFEWEDDHEFSYSGEMYDIIEKEITGNILYVRCVKDEKENQLVKEFNKLVAGKASSDSSKNNTSDLLQLIALQFLPAAGMHVHIPGRTDRTYNCRERSDLQSIAYDILTPPPRVV